MNPRWPKTYLLAISLTLLAVLGAENHRREQGFRATVVDSKSLWSVQRARVDDNPDTLAVLGASRMQLGFSERAFDALYPGWNLINLTVNGHYPIATLQDLAFNSEFRGVVIIALDARALFVELHGMQQPWVDYYHRDFGPGLWLNAQLAATAQSRRVTANPDFSLVRRLTAWLDDSGSPQPTYVVFDKHRWGHADYAAVDAEFHRGYRADGMAEFYTTYPLPDPDTWLAGTKPLLEATRVIEARGGRVLMVRMPTNGRYWALDEQYFPRRDYWHRLAEQPDVKALHAVEDGPLAAFPLPDGSHLDERDKENFTRILLTRLDDLYGWSGQYAD